MVDFRLSECRELGTVKISPGRCTHLLIKACRHIVCAWLTSCLHHGNTMEKPTVVGRGNIPVHLHETHDVDSSFIGLHGHSIHTQIHRHTHFLLRVSVYVGVLRPQDRMWGGCGDGSHSATDHGTRGTRGTHGRTHSWSGGNKLATFTKCCHFDEPYFTLVFPFHYFILELHGAHGPILYSLLHFISLITWVTLKIVEDICPVYKMSLFKDELLSMYVF